MTATQAASKSSKRQAIRYEEGRLMIWDPSGQDIFHQTREDDKGEPYFEFVDPTWRDELLLRGDWEAAEELGLLEGWLVDLRILWNRIVGK